MKPKGFAFGALKQRLLGAPIPSHLAHEERLTKVTGLAVLSSDALSSVAYATEEILRVLILAGPGALALLTPVGGLVAALLLIVVLSYRQTILAYPPGGGAYVVARENLGTRPGLVAAASLLIDYVLTVAVSIAAGVAALTSAFPGLQEHRVALALITLTLLTVGNLRGVRASGRIFSLPTYFFIAALFALLAVGAWRALHGTLPAAAPAPMPAPLAAPLGLFLLMRAFASGCTAMTGVEAVSNGVPAFRPPESRNAAAVLLIMAAISITSFLGITLLATRTGLGVSESETLISQLARTIFDGRGVGYFSVQAGTMLILFLAANTAYADFPRLASIIARDSFLPRQLANQGDRLAFSNGIIALALCAGLLLVVFRCDTHALLPLYMVGVFISFTLSQAGMVRKSWRDRARGWRLSALLNSVGCLSTGAVLLVVAAAKFTHGAWIILLLIPLLVLLFQAVRRHYLDVERQLALDDSMPGPALSGIILVPVSGVQRAVLHALDYARSLGGETRALYVDTGSRSTETFRLAWEKWGRGVPLVVVDSPYRSVLQPLLAHLRELQAAHPEATITVVLPEYVPTRWWHHLLHNQRALMIKGALLFARRTVVISVPFHLEAGGRRP